jgi:hypothetical protein
MINWRELLIDVKAVSDIFHNSADELSAVVTYESSGLSVSQKYFVD